MDTQDDGQKQVGDEPGESCSMGTGCPICDVGLAAMKSRFRPYLIGIGIGVLSWITFYGMGKALGTSTTMPKLAGTAIGVVSPQTVEANSYWSKYFNAEAGKVMFDWQFFLVVGLIGGALVGKRLINRDKFVEHVPPLWQSRFGSSRLLRYAAAFVGGVIMVFGARMAGGCTSGHGISGGLQLAVSSWTFFMAMFASGVVTAFALFGMKGRQHV